MPVRLRRWNGVLSLCLGSVCPQPTTLVGQAPRGCMSRPGSSVYESEGARRVKQLAQG